jgi:O-antigen ligase
VLAAVIPVTAVLAAITGVRALNAELLVLGFLSAWWLRAAVRVQRSDGPPPSRVTWAAVVFALLVASSCVVQLWVLHLRLGEAFWPSVWVFISSEYFHPYSALRQVKQAAIPLEGVALLIAIAVIGRGRPDWIRRLAMGLAIGGTAAALFNIRRLVQVAARTDAPGASLLHYLGWLRINVAYGDVNAAGSYFAAILVLTVALGWRAGWLRWPALAAATAQSIALWLTGSRAALGAALIALGASSVRWSRPHVRNLPRAAAVLVVIVLVVGAAIRFYPARQAQSGAATALAIRQEMARTTLRMVAPDPIFGVGIGRYPELSAGLSSPALLEAFPAATLGENAHNNFLQILAELGLLGLAAFVWVLCEALRGVSSARGTLRGDPLRLGVLAAIAAFLLTCLVGHPLLIEVPAYTFWMLLGLAAAMHPIPDTATRSNLTRRAALTAAALVAAIVISTPVRSWQQARRADLENVALGVSGWQRSADGTAFRWAGQHATFYVPANATAIVLPLRPADSGDLGEVELRLDGQLANRVRLAEEGWTRVRLVMPRPEGAPRFRRLEVILIGEDPGTQEEVGVPELMIGRLQID